MTTDRPRVASTGTAMNYCAELSTVAADLLEKRSRRARAKDQLIPEANALVTAAIVALTEAVALLSGETVTEERRPPVDGA